MIIPLALLSGTPGPGEVILVFFVILVLFGPKHLPKIARNIGRILNKLRYASEDFKKQIIGIEENYSPVDIPSASDDVPGPDSPPEKSHESKEEHGKRENDVIE